MNVQYRPTPKQVKKLVFFVKKLVFFECKQSSLPRGPIRANLRLLLLTIFTVDGNGTRLAKICTTKNFCVRTGFVCRSPSYRCLFGNKFFSRKAPFSFFFLKNRESADFYFYWGPISRFALFQQQLE